MRRFRSLVAIGLLPVFCFVSIGFHFALAQKVKKELSDEEKHLKSFLEERRDKFTADAIRSNIIGALMVGSGIGMLVLTQIPPPRIVPYGELSGIFDALIRGFLFVSIVGTSIVLIGWGVGFFILGLQSSEKAQKFDQEIKTRFLEPT